MVEGVVDVWEGLAVWEGDEGDRVGNSGGGFLRA